MIFAFYGNYYYIVKELEGELEGNTNISLSEFLEKKPQLREPITHKIEKIAVKFIEKGTQRHTIIQAILADYFRIEEDQERQKNFADSIKEKLPSLLASKQGLYVACACFTILDAKDRKVVVKSLKEILKETFTNKIAHLFVVHVLNTLDDTQLSKKKIIAVINIY